MLNTLRVDIKRYSITKSFIILAILIAFLQPLFTEIVMLLVGDAMKADFDVTINNFADYSTLASIFLAIVITMFLHSEVGEGIVRNKLISGKKRYQVLISYCVVNSAVAAILQIISILAVVIVAICSGSTISVEVDEVIRYTWVTVLAGIAISVLYTAAYLCFCTNKMAIAIPGFIAVFMKICQFVILDATYTESGVPKVSGITLKIYEGIDRFVAFFHMNPPLRHDNASYLIGNIILIIASILVGSIVFSRKDLK